MPVREGPLVRYIEPVEKGRWEVRDLYGADDDIIAVVHPETSSEYARIEVEATETFRPAELRALAEALVKAAEYAEAQYG